ncbi:MAG: NAD+ synthase [Candidatus Bathyarchaeota archaeon]
MQHENCFYHSLDYAKVTEEIYNFIRKVVGIAHASGVIIGLSGGVDSSLIATLCVNALGSKKVLGIIMPTDFTPKEDLEDAGKLAEQLGVHTQFINIQQVCNILFKDLESDSNDSRQRMTRANVYARMRMIILYYFANLNNYLVVGTGDRSEALIGFFTKYGDGGADLFPIMHLYKTQVRELAQYLGVPEKISQKPSSPQLYPGHKATDEIPLDYDKLDPILIGLFDRKFDVRTVSNRTNVSLELVNEVLHRFDISKHKRDFPPLIKTS